MQQRNGNREHHQPEGTGEPITRKEVAEAIGCDEATISRYERGLTRPKPTDVDAMLNVYGVTDEDYRRQLLEAAKEARKRGWWHRHRKTLKRGFDSYIGFEAAASVVRTYESQLITVCCRPRRTPARSSRRQPFSTPRQRT